MVIKPGSAPTRAFNSLQRAALRILRRFGTDAHVYQAGSTQVSYGQELYPQPDFNAATGLAVGAGWAISGGLATLSAGAGILNDATNYTAYKTGTTYTVTVVIDSHPSGGSFQIYLRGNAVATSGLTAAGTYSYDVVAGSSTTEGLAILGVSACVGSITSASVREKITSSSVINSLLSNNYILSDGSTGYSAVDGPAGLVLDGAGSVGSELAPATSSTAGWTAISSAVITSDGTSLTTKNGAASEGRASFGTTVANGTYQVNITVVSVVGGTGVLIVGNTRVALTGAGTYTRFIVATDTSGIGVATNTATLNDQVVFNNFSAKQVTGIHATQATTANKPTVRRGALNLLFQSVFAGSAGGPGTVPTGWTGTGVNGNNPVAVLAETPVNASSQVVRLRRISATGGEGLQRSSVDGVTLNTPVIISAYVRVPTGVTATDLNFYSGTGVPNLPMLVSAATLNAQAKDAWVRYSVTATFTTIPSLLSFALGNGSAGTGCDITCPQIETGSIASDYSPTTSAAASNATAGRYSLEFDKTDSIAMSAPAFQMADDSCTIAAMMCPAATPSDAYFVNPASGAANQLVSSLAFQTGTGKIQAAWVTDAAAQVIAILDSTNRLGQRVVATAVKRGAAKQLRVNGAQAGSTDNTAIITPTTVSAGVIGGFNVANTSLQAFGTVSIVIAIKGTLSDADMLTLERFAASTLPNAPSF